jgi:hypothetical protein
VATVARVNFILNWIIRSFMSKEEDTWVEPEESLMGRKTSTCRGATEKSPLRRWRQLWREMYMCTNKRKVRKHT